jgi:hypothetical protein
MIAKDNNEDIIHGISGTTSQIALPTAIYWVNVKVHRTAVDRFCRVRDLKEEIKANK